MLLRYFSRPDYNADGFNVFGYFSKYLGQSEVARVFVNKLISQDEHYTLVDFYDGTHKRITIEEEEKYLKHYYKKLKYKNNIFFIDLMVLRDLMKQIPILFRNKHNIVTFWWEFESGFEDRIPILNEFDEVYVFSDFIKNTLTRVEDRKFKIIKIKYPFIKNWTIEESPMAVRNKNCLENKFCFFFNFDYLSSYNRKNPEAILKALHEEFPTEEEVVFVVKTSNTLGFEDKEKKFISLVKEYRLTDRVIINKDQLTRSGLMTLLNSMDCYISLHRGEGLGLGILEAFALDKPVIATNYGGNTEYMDHPLGYPVPYTLVRANDDYLAYRNVISWAEPDIDYAKKFMREVYIQYKMNN
ncbi:MAG: hypothetical protein A2W85_01730 [Bacteroidetes bacterium GWF2_41_31]|nr:MAG: hypothetical protein A2W85_01730 [Bacteroidetes bacterium GWF2_41_31]